MEKNGVPKVQAMYQNEGQVGARAVISVTFHEGRRLSFGELANGDIRDIPILDILDRPDVFLAPCGKPFIINGATVEDPCESPLFDEALESTPADEELKPPADLYQEKERLTEVFGSEELAEKLILAGYPTPESALQLGDDGLIEMVGKAAAGKWRKWAAATGWYPLTNPGPDVIDVAAEEPTPVVKKKAPAKKAAAKPKANGL
jgi:hypothetical protein